MLIAGLDLAAEPKNSALALINWQPEGGTLISLQTDVDDNQIITAAGEVEKLGIDCALGWPVDFVDFISGNYQSEHLDARTTVPFIGDLSFRRKLAYRETDRVVRELTGRWPLSVSTDRLAMTAIRTTGILSQMVQAGAAIDRAGKGLVVEVYPAATLKIWGFKFAGYRNSTSLRRSIIQEVCARAPWLDLGGFEDILVESCDALDSLLAALAARAAQRGGFVRPKSHQLKLAHQEGWIAIPTIELGALLGSNK